MRKFAALVFMWMMIFWGKVQAQRIEPLSSLRQVPAEKYLRFHYDNDYFTATDHYYTQGITLEYADPSLGKNFLRHALLRPFDAPSQYALSLNLYGFTPRSISKDFILYGDRPFDANISLQLSSAQIDEQRKRKIVSNLQLGVMGPLAAGYEIQYYIHKWTGNQLPKGWQFQIANDLILNYQVQYEQQLLAVKNNVLVSATAGVQAGTIFNKANVGMQLMLGKFHPRYQQHISGGNKVSYYFFSQGRMNAVGYDATMQGGLFNRSSPYTIASADISRLVFQADAGLVLNFRKLFLRYTQSYLTKEFESGSYHRWGGISVGLGF